MALVPYFTRVVVALTRFCRSADSDTTESADELRDFREDVHSLMQDVLVIVGADTIYMEVCLSLPLCVCAVDWE